MKILYPCLDTADNSEPLCTVERVLESIGYEEGFLEKVTFSETKLSEETRLAIVVNENEDHNWHSLNFINHIVNHNIPFIYLVKLKGNFSLDLVERYGPDYLLIPPYSNAILEDTIILSVKKYLGNPMDESTKVSGGKLWLQVKRGSYQSVDIHSIQII